MNTITSAQVPDLAAKLPPFPKVVPELIACLDQENSAIDDLVKIARNDPIISAKILSCANQLRRIRVQKDTADLFSAAALIGYNKMRELILAASLNNFLAHSSGQVFFYEHSLAVAICAREIAILTHHQPEAAYIAGILHDVGQLCFYMVDTELYSSVRRMAIETGNLLQLEIQNFGLDHCHLGMLLANQWSLPQAILLAISSHHTDEALWENPLQAIVNLAESICSGLDIPHSPHNRVSRLNLSAAEYLGLKWDSEQIIDLFGRTRAQFEYARQLN